MSNVIDYFSKSFLQRCARNDKNYKYLILLYIFKFRIWRTFNRNIYKHRLQAMCLHWMYWAAFLKCVFSSKLDFLMSVPFVVNKIPHHFYFNKLCLAQTVLPGFTIYQGGSTKSIAGEQFSMVLSKFGLLGMNCICTV